MYLKRFLKNNIINRPYFSTRDVVIGKGVIFGKNVRFNCKKVRIGDGVVFQDNIKIQVDEFVIGDFGTVYSDCFFPGPGTIHIGHNFWLGKGSIVDGQGGTIIGNNVGIGAYSQLWTHMKFGDTLRGCRFHSSKQLIVEDDVWLVGHVMVSPVTLGARSLVMLGSVVTSDLKTDCTYAGVPAKDVTEKLGPQFSCVERADRVAHLTSRLDEFAMQAGMASEKFRESWGIVPETAVRPASDDFILFDVDRGTYQKKGTSLERRVLRFLLPDIKFVPDASN